MGTAAFATALVGAALTILLGGFLLVLGGLAGLAGSESDSQEAIDAGALTMLLGIAVVGGAFLTRRRPIGLAVTAGAAAVVGFFLGNALWLFVAPVVALSAVLSLLSLRA